MARLRVIHIIWSAGIGGIERLVFDLVKAQQKNNELEVSVLISKDGGVYIDRFLGLEIPCHVLGMAGALDFSPARAARVKKLFADADVIHFHSFNPWIAWHAIKSRKAVVYTEHGNFAIGRKKSFTEAVNTGLLKKFLNTKVDFISFNSAFTQNTALMRYRLKCVKQEVVANGIDFSQQESPAVIPEEIQTRIAGKFIVGTCSRFVAVKKIDRLIRAYALFCRNKSDVVLMLCGDGPARGNYETLVRELQIDKQVIITGYTDHARTYMELMHVGVYPSSGEAFGLAAVETLAAGTPVIVFSDGGGLTEIVSGISMEDVVADETVLLNRMEYYYRDKSTSFLKRNERMKYAEKYNIREMESKFFHHYQKLTS